MYLYSDVHIDSSCMCAECAVSGSKTLSRAASLPYMKTVRYSYLTFAQTLLNGNNHLRTQLYYNYWQLTSCYTRPGLRTQICVFRVNSSIIIINDGNELKLIVSA